MLEVLNIVKSYEGVPLLRGVSFAVTQDETVCLLGPSGSGKSTLLLIIAGLQVPEDGQVRWDGEDLAAVPAHMRDFGLVFQDYTLFPHLNVFDNVAFGLRMKRWPSDQVMSRVNEVLELVNLEGFENRRVTDLSGGEQQRVALARALGPRPRLIMFDEPLGALDRALREELLVQLRRILTETRLPAIYVTHDQSEAAAIADRVLLLHEGQIIREGPLSELWAHPGSAWAAEFLGVGKVLKGRIMDGGSQVQTEYGAFPVKCTGEHQAGDSVSLLARAASDGSGRTVRGRVVEVAFQQGRYKAVLDNGFSVYLDAAPKLGDEMPVKVQAECLE
jgi:ABC-type Fe3+/spermidine/putrescine transport system ATPase subunit